MIDKYGLPQATDNTVTDRAELLREFEEIWNRGVAFNYGERTVGLHAVGDPVSGPKKASLGHALLQGRANGSNVSAWKENCLEESRKQ